jgi:hypothetical protein
MLGIATLGLGTRRWKPRDWNIHRAQSDINLHQISDDRRPSLLERVIPVPDE